MKKLINWLKPSLTRLKWIDDNIVHIFLTIFILLIPLYPKFPLFDVEYTYVSIRLEDVFIAVFYVIFLIQVLRKKIVFRSKFFITFILFWISVFASYIIGHYFLKTIPVQFIGLYHALRRVEYMFVFFVAASAIKSEKTLYFFLKVYFVALLFVSLFGIGQRFFDFPAVQTMNPEYARGRILHLTPEARISSTFGGHFDLSAYLVFSIPIVLGYYFFSKKKKMVILFILALTTLLYTAQRSSFAAYAATVSLFVLLSRKFLFYLFVIVITGILVYATGDLVTRLAKTFQFRTIFINNLTGNVTINQKITAKELPAGNVEIPVVSKKKKKVARKPVDKKTQQEILELARKQTLEEAQKKGQQLTSKEIERLAKQMASFIKVKDTILCDISCSTRIQIEWPRAMAAFVLNPMFGSGPSSITEATDNDYLRWLGEYGIVGTLLFVFILISLIRHIRKAKKHLPQEQKYLYSGFLFGLFGLLINATYIDVFEASKVAYMFWVIAGLYIGSTYLVKYEKRTNK